MQKNNKSGFILSCLILFIVLLFFTKIFNGITQIKCNSPITNFHLQLNQLAKLSEISAYQISYQNKNIQTNCIYQTKATHPFSLETKMGYASLSKVLTSAMAAKMVEQGYFTYFDSLDKLIPAPVHSPATSAHNIKVHELLSHRAGFDRRKSGDPIFALDPWCHTRSQEVYLQRSDFEPGADFSYSNLGYCLVGSIIANRMKQSLHDVMRAYLKSLDISSIHPFDGKSKESEFFVSQLPLKYREFWHTVNADSLLASGGLFGNSQSFLKLIEKVFFSTELLTINSVEKIKITTALCDASQWRKCHGLAFYKHQVPGKPAFFWRDGMLPSASNFAGFFNHGDRFVFLGLGGASNGLAFNDAVGQLIYRSFATP